MFRLLTRPPLWLAAIVVWVVTIYFLSSTSKTMPEGGFEIPHIDKILHFGYFFGGGIILTTYLLLLKGPGAPIRVRFIIPLLFFAAVGALDEYHQTFTPGRSGNDPFDWLADVLGAAAGILLAHRLHPFLLKISAPPPRP
jgi:VanZ family protein